MAELMSQVLDYSKRRQKASKANSMRVIIPSSNGSSFQAGQVCEISIPGNQPGGTFMDWASSYLKFTITNNGAATPANDVVLGGNIGAYNMIQKIEILSSGYTLSSIDNYNKLVGMLGDIQLGEVYKNQTGALLAGMEYTEVTGAVIDGLTIAGAGGSQTFCLPLLACPFTSSSKYFPLFSRDQLKLRITFASAANGTIGAAADSVIVMSPVELVATNIKLGEQSFQALNQMVGGQYKIVTTDYRNSTSAISDSQTSFVANVAFSHLSLERVLFGFFGTENTPAADSNSNRDYHNLSEYSFVLNGEHYPARKIKASDTNGAEPFAELANSADGLVDVHFAGTLNKNTNYIGAGATSPAGTQNDNTGHFLAGINLQQTREHGSESIYSGVDSLGGVTQIEGTFDAAGDACNLQAFSEFTVIYNLDTNPGASNTWVYSS